jgi:hypothetical protein
MSLMTRRTRSIAAPSFAQALMVSQNLSRSDSTGSPFSPTSSLAPSLRQIVFAVGRHAQDDRPRDVVTFSEDIDPQHCSVAGRYVDVTLDEDVAR